MSEKLDQFRKDNRRKLTDISWDKEVNENVKQIELSSIMLNNFEKIDYFSEFNENIKNLQKDIKRYIDNAINPTYQIAVIGAIKAGKSTLINALLGHELASVNVTPETATLTKFKSSIKNNIKVVFYTKEDWEEIWKSAVDKKAEIFIKEYENLEAERVKDKYLGAEEIFMEFNDFEAMKKEISKWTSSQEKEHYFVKEIEIGLRDLNLPSQISLVDTPGLNDIIEYRSQITRDYIDNANAVIVCVNAKTLRSDEMFTINSVFSQARYKKDKIYVLGTQIDTMNSIEDWEKQRKDWIKHLSTRTCFEKEEVASKHLIGISSYAYSTAKNIGKILTLEEFLKLIQLKLIFENQLQLLSKLQNNTLTEEESLKIKKDIVKYSNVNLVRDVIENRLLQNHNEDLRKDFEEKYKIINNQIYNFSKNQEDVLKKILDEFNLNKEELEKEIELNKIKIKEHEEKTMELEDSLRNIRREFKVDFHELENNFNELKEKIKEIYFDVNQNLVKNNSIKNNNVKNNKGKKEEKNINLENKLL